MPSATIRNPKNPRHLMRVKPVRQLVRVTRGGDVLAESRGALRVMEVAGDALDPVVYFPREDVRADLKPVADKSTHCPLKGDAEYFSLPPVDPIAWRYPAPLEFAKVIAGYVAFYPNEVTLEEIGDNA
jgi:uncharacterized protein (DUF427 family)